MKQMRISSSTLAAAALTLMFSSPAHAGSIELTQCGQSLAKGVYFLSADLDCQNADDGVRFTGRATLELRGFSLRNTIDAVACAGSCKIKGPGAIENGLGYGVFASGDVSIGGDVAIANHAEDGVRSFRTVKMRDASVSGSGGNGIRAPRIRAKRSSVVDNGEDGIHIVNGLSNGIYGINQLRLGGVIATGNASSIPPCGVDRVCADVNSPIPPRLNGELSCGSSYNSEHRNDMELCSDD